MAEARKKRIQDTKIKLYNFFLFRVDWPNTILGPQHNLYQNYKGFPTPLNPKKPPHIFSNTLPRPHF